MSRFRSALLAFYCLAVSALAGEVAVRHRIAVRLDPGRGTVDVTDAMTWSVRPADGVVRFLLHRDLSLKETPGTTVAKLLDRAPEAVDFGMSPDHFEPPKDVPVRMYEAALPADAPPVLTVSYSGAIRQPPTPSAEEYSRGFSETPGIIEERGVYLCGASAWVPWTGDGFISFELKADVPSPWGAVSQGRRVSSRAADGRCVVEWDCPDPSEEVYLVAGPYTEYSRAAGPTSAMVFLRSPDAALADKFLEVTAQYLEMYRDLVGPFPYPKFALVENFWETGYGMPSFTLLGEKVIRFPFILHSSYPHELLHNYWGNSVFADVSSGNWSEGLTTYLADHLIAEQRGQGEEYRRTSLKKFTDYVRPETDFPLSAFRNRKDALTEAVGYGKSMMVWHMLRRDLGDDAFREGVRTFYTKNRFKRASFEDVRAAFESASKRDLTGFFHRWTDLPGAPGLKVSQAEVKKESSRYVLEFALAQTPPPPDALPLRVPLAVTLEGMADAVQVFAEMAGPERRCRLEFTARPVRVDVDPAFDIMRRMDPMETPPSLSVALGAERVLVVLPSAGPDAVKQAFKTMAEGWAGEKAGRVEIATDQEVKEWPKDRSVWVLGLENALRPKVEAAMAPSGVRCSQSGVSGTVETVWSGRCAVMAARHPGDPSKCVVWVAADNPAAVPGLGRKLPHYGKYGWLVFEGDEPVNIMKGQWVPAGSPLTVFPKFEGAPGSSVPMGKAAPRKPLAEAPAVFDVESMRRDIGYLAGPETAGRGIGTEGAKRASDYLSSRFKAVGLKPWDATSGYTQSWADTSLAGKPSVELRNVLGFVPGRNPALAGQTVVVCAHYDHLGDGRAGAHAGDEGKIHPGADDDASGVAVLLELARMLSAAPMDRTVVFALFTGEESGLLGSRHFVEAASPFPVEKVFAVLNLDTVGRLGKGKLFTIGHSSAREWPHIFRGCAYVTGVPVEAVPQELESGDQATFIKRGIPAVQLLTEPHADYHRPTDTPDRIDYPGLARVAAVAMEAVLYLGARPEPMNFTGKAAGGQAGQAKGAGEPAAGSPPVGTPPARPSSGKSAAMGIMPDFAFAGPGVRVGAVSDGGPAAQAGIRVGDVILKLGDAATADMQSYTAALRARQPGDTVAVRFQRDGSEGEVAVTLRAR